MLRALLSQGPVAIGLAAAGLVLVMSAAGAAIFENLALKTWFGAMVGGFIGLCWLIGLHLQLQGATRQRA